MSRIEPYTESKDYIEVQGTTHGVTMEQVLALMADVAGMTEAEVISLIAEHGEQGLTEAEVIELIGEYGTVGDFAAADHTHEEYAPNTHSHSEYLTEQAVIDLIGLHGYAGFTEQEIVDLIGLHGLSLEDLGDYAKTADHYTKAEMDATVGMLATQEDLAGLATQEDLVGLATQEDLVGLATQEDLTDLATKAEIADFVTGDALTGFITEDDLTDLATKTELSTVAAELADPVVLMSETAFAGITPDPGKIYIVYGE